MQRSPKRICHTCWQ